jgi:hypothetical protein
VKNMEWAAESVRKGTGDGATDVILRREGVLGCGWNRVAQPVRLYGLL